MRGLYYRHKLLLALVETRAGRRGFAPAEFQSLLRRLAALQSQPSYDFAPTLDEGWVSFQAEHDLKTLRNRELLAPGARIRCIAGVSPPTFVEAINDTDRAALVRLGERPPVDTAISAIPQAISAGTVGGELFTIGYEGKSIEAFLKQLLAADIELLVDVRSNPFSYKYGFSKGLLGPFCRRVGIGYEHIPELGVPAKLRKQMKAGDSRAGVFRYYSRELLSPSNTGLKRLREILDHGARVALTCFEAAACDCHRSYLAARMRRELHAPVDVVDL